MITDFLNTIRLSEAFIIGHSQIDAEHQELVDLINAMVVSYNHENFEDCALNLDRFAERLDRHCDEEEEIMLSLGFRIVENHQKSHSRSLSVVADWQAKEKTASQWKDCIFDMCNVLIDNVVREDLKFKSYLQAIDYRE